MARLLVPGLASVLVGMCALVAGALLIPGAALPAAAATPQRAVAITIDDLPRGLDGGPRERAAVQAMTARLLRALREQHVPVIGFVNAGRHGLDEAGLRQVLDQWLDAGAELGNHSWSHPDINNVGLEAYTADIVRGEPPLRAALEPRGARLRYYRHPYLHLGTTPEMKAGLAKFLADRGYTVAPVTLDNSDYAFAGAYTQPQYREQARREYLPYMESVVEFFERRSVDVVGREFPQILLIHANELNADVMPELLAMFRRRGYRFVSLEEALRDPAYRLREDYVGRGGFSWIHRWSRAKGMPGSGEPEPAGWVMKAFAERPVPPGP